MRSTPALWTVVLCSLAAAVVILWATANGLRNAGLGVLPAALIGLGWLARTGRAAFSAQATLLASILVFLAVELYGGVYRDAAIHQLDTRVEAGAFAGIYTTAERARFIGDLSRDLAIARDGAESILFFDYFPAGYLFGSEQPRTPALWMFSSNPAYQGNARIRTFYAQHFVSDANLPDLVVRMERVRLGWILDASLPRTDPVLRRFATDRYAQVLRRPGDYSILRRVRTGPAL